MSDVVYFIISITCVNVLLHSLGLYLLIYWYRTKGKTPQKLLLIYLSISELVYNVVGIARDVVHLRNHRVYRAVTNIVAFTGINWMVTFAMFFITADRLLAILLNMRYQRLCSNGKAIRLVVITAVINTSIGVLTGVLRYYKLMQAKILTLYVNPTISLLYFAFALITYVILFLKYLQSQRNMRRLPTDNTRISPWKAFVGSRFFIPVLLIGSYLLLISVPSLARTAAGWTKSDSSANLTYEVLSRLSYTVDAIIYIYVSKPVRNILLTRLTLFHNIIRTGIFRNTQEVSFDQSIVTTNAYAINRINSQANNGGKKQETGDEVVLYPGLTQYVTSV